MNFRNVHVSRRSATVLAVLIGTLSLGIGAHAALYKRVTEPSTLAAVPSSDAKGAARVALVIGNSRYPDANAPLVHPVSDARALAAELQRDGFEVETIEDAGKKDMRAAVERLKARIRPDAVAMLFFAGYGVQAGRENYMIPVDAAIWREADVRREGTSIESVLEAMKERGARAKLVVVDASRRNPYERRFRFYSHGLAPIAAPDNALILSSATPGQVVDDGSGGQHSLLVSELLNNLNSPAAASAIFSKTRLAVAKASNGRQVPVLSSSLLDEIRFDAAATSDVAKAGS